MGKKKPEEMAAQREKFINGAKAKGFDEKKVAKIFDLMEQFAGYGFNKSHSAAYALLAYQTAYLKAHYPVCFMSALLTSEISSTDKIVKYINECRDMGIKILPPDSVADPDRKRRFVQEAKAASALNHPNIVTIFDLAAHEGTDFIVMEYVAGRTLDRVLSGTGLPLKQVLSSAIKIADALAKAHEAGIIHRDLKPSNLMVTPTGDVKILDFGVAKLLEETEPSSATKTAVATQEGTTVGTPAYMSPEQAEGRPLDGRSDIFSFGCGPRFERRRKAGRHFRDCR